MGNVHSGRHGLAAANHAARRGDALGNFVNRADGPPDAMDDARHGGGAGGGAGGGGLGGGLGGQ